MAFVPQKLISIWFESVYVIANAHPYCLAQNWIDWISIQSNRAACMSQ